MNSSPLETVGLAIGIVLLGMICRAWWRIERKARLEMRGQRMAFKHRARAQILVSGVVETLPSGVRRPSGWVFNCYGVVPHEIVVSDGQEAHILYGGYTIAELEEIAKQPSEFVLS